MILLLKQLVVGRDDTNLLEDHKVMQPHQRCRAAAWQGILCKRAEVGR